MDIITFPTTPEAFTAYQEAVIGRELDDFEREFAAVVVELVNTSYQEGVDGDENTITMKLVREFHKERGQNPDLFIHTWESICWWCDKAYERGQREAQA